MWFSDYEAFALVTGLRLLAHRWPQSFVVGMLRFIRLDLEREHARILKQNPKALFDQQKIVKNAKAGDLYVDNTDPVFLTVVSGEGDPKEAPKVLVTGAVCHGTERMSVFVKHHRAQSYTLTELVTPAHRLLSELAKVEPRKRGRSS